jgi:methionine-rich copper-binding protein CopC
MLAALALGIGVAALASPGPAFSHANYSSSVPASGGYASPPLTRVDVYFTQDLDLGGLNSLNVLNPNLVDIDNNDATVDPANHKHMFITLQSGLIPGLYRVDWVNLAVDGHAGSGSFNFNLNSAVGGVTGLTEAGRGAVQVDGSSRSAVAAGALAVATLVMVSGGLWRVARRRHGAAR